MWLERPKSCIIPGVIDLEQFSLYPEATDSQPTPITLSSLWGNGDKREIHQWPGLMSDIGNLPMHANTIDPHRDVLNFQTNLFDSDSPLEKRKVILMIWRNSRYKVTQTTAILPRLQLSQLLFKFRWHALLEMPSRHHSLTQLSNEGSLWADPELGPGSTKKKKKKKKTQIRLC